MPIWSAAWGSWQAKQKNRPGRALAAIVRNELSSMDFVCSSCFILVVIVVIRILIKHGGKQRTVLER